MRHHLRPLLAQGLMAECCFSILTESEQLLEDYKALDLLILILNVISAGQFLQMSSSPSPSSPVSLTATLHSTQTGSGQNQGLQVVHMN